MATWSRPVVSPPARFCRVVAIGASVETACTGRWDAREPREDHQDPPAAERCGACVSVIEVERPVSEFVGAAGSSEEGGAERP